MGEFTIEVSTPLRASADEVWAHACTLAGVNDELGPWVRMTAPAALRDKRLGDLAVGREAGVSVLLFLGIVPFDLHHLVIERVLDRGFDEESWSWLQRRWRHERRVVAAQDGCVVTDRLTVVPRWAPVALVRPIVHAIFRARHRKLRARFGDRPTRPRLRSRRPTRPRLRSRRSRMCRPAATRPRLRSRRSRMCHNVIRG